MHSVVQMFDITRQMKQDCSATVRVKCRSTHDLLMDHTSPNVPFCFYVKFMYLELVVDIVLHVQNIFYYSETSKSKCQKHMAIRFCQADVLEKGPLSINVVRSRCSSQRH